MHVLNKNDSLKRKQFFCLDGSRQIRLRTASNAHAALFERRPRASHCDGTLRFRCEHTSQKSNSQRLTWQVHYWKHGRIGPYTVEKPLVLGHESAGIVRECGQDVKGLKAGDRIALEPGVGCNFCKACRAGRYNLCSAMQFAATPPYDGTLAAYYVLPEECCFKLPENISLREGALVEPLAVAVHVCRLAGDAQGKSVAIFGAGPVGLLCSSVMRAFGASGVVVIDLVDSRLASALDYGATSTYKMTQEAPQQNAELLLSCSNLPDGVEIVIDATGAEPCISCGVECLARGGMFVQAGLGAAKVEVAPICDKEATFKGSFRYGPGDYQLAIELLSTGRVKVEGLITHDFDFSEAEKAFKNVAGRQGIKSVIYGPGIDVETAKRL